MIPQEVLLILGDILCHPYMALNDLVTYNNRRFLP